MSHEHNWILREVMKHGVRFHQRVCTKCKETRTYDMDVLDRSKFLGPAEFEAQRQRK